MSIFPTTRIGRALVVSAVVVGAAKIVPFLLQVFSLTGDELTELPPLTPAGTDTTFLLANPVAWFLAVAATVYVVLALRDVVAHVVSPPPPRRPRPRRPAQRSTTQRSTAQRSTTQRSTTQRSTTQRSTTQRSTAGRPAARRSAPARRPSPRR